MEENKKKEKKSGHKILWTCAALGIAFAWGYSKGSKDQVKFIKKQMYENVRKLNFGNGITMPLYYNKKDEKCIQRFFGSIEKDLCELYDIKKIREVAK